MDTEEQAVLTLWPLGRRGDPPGGPENGMAVDPMLAWYRCWAEVDLDALRDNLAWIRHRVGPAVRVLTVVKADAYGHGLKHIAAHLMRSGTDVFGVANLVEARAIRSVGKGWPILMLGACLPEEIEGAVHDGVMPTISTLEEVDRFSRVAARLGRAVHVHVKVDTGMGRLGAAPGLAAELIEQTTRLPAIKLEGVFTHYASAEDDADFSAVQRERFREVLRQLADRGVQVPTVHANNSAALLHEPDTAFDLVRPGLMVYGVPPPGARRSGAILQRHIRPALSLRCRVSYVKDVPKGVSLSYGRAFTTPRRMRIATITAGYGDGYLRAGSNQAQVLVRGCRCRVVGCITMDQTLVDVSRVPGARASDEVVLIGREGNEEITAGELAAWSGTVPWEVLTNISYRVPRVYRGAQAA